MPIQSSIYKHTQEVDYLADLVGADVAQDLLKARIDPVATGPLDVTATTVPTTTRDESHETNRRRDLASNDEITVATLSSPGSANIYGQVKSTGSYTVRLDWGDGDGNTIRQEEVAAGVASNTWTDLDVNPKSPYVEVVVADASGSSQTVDATVNMV